jgi:hypothetical protein
MCKVGAFIISFAKLIFVLIKTTYFKSKHLSINDLGDKTDNYSKLINLPSKKVLFNYFTFDFNLII